MKNVQDLLEDANNLFEHAEAAAEETSETSRQLFLQGIALLFEAFLTVNGVAGTGDILGLFNQCKQLEEDFGDIEAELECLMKINANGLQPEDLIDYANEIWDFVVDFLDDADCP